MGAVSRGRTRGRDRQPASARRPFRQSMSTPIRPWLAGRGRCRLATRTAARAAAGGPGCGFAGGISAIAAVAPKLPSIWKQDWAGAGRRGWLRWSRPGGCGCCGGQALRRRGGRQRRHPGEAPASTAAAVSEALLSAARAAVKRRGVRSGRYGCRGKDRRGEKGAGGHGPRARRPPTTRRAAPRECTGPGGAASGAAQLALDRVPQVQRLDGREAVAEQSARGPEVHGRRRTGGDCDPSAARKRCSGEVDGQVTRLLLPSS